MKTFFLTRETIERYIAVPISSTDHLLISSTGTGQHYLAEPVSALLSERIQVQKNRGIES